MESQLPTSTLGSSLPVPNVQELAKISQNIAPSRYVRSDLDPPIKSNDFPSSLQIPVIDMEKLLSEEFLDSELEKFHFACKEWGFFQLRNHGVSLSLLEKLKTEVKDFFNLPMDEKKKFSQKEGEIEGLGQAFVKSEDQKLDWADRFFLTTLPPRLRKPDLLPKLPLPLRDTLEAYSNEVNKLAMKIVNFMEKALKIEPNDMMGMFEEGWQSMRMNYYPPCSQPNAVIGLSPHSDSGGFTILLQVNETEGLQIRKDGNWVPVKPLPNAFVVNIGNTVEILTNGIYPSIEHRATIDSLNERLSIATFCSPNLDVELGPVPGLVTPETPALFKRIQHTDYLKGYFSRELDGKSYVNAIKTNSK